MPFAITMRFVCSSCSQERCPYAKLDGFTFVQGCYPCDCIYTTFNQKTEGSEKEKAAAQNMCTTVMKCPYTAGNNFKPGKFGCPKFAEDGKTEFCQHGVRGIVAFLPASCNPCFLGDHYTFNPQADLKAYSVNSITHGTPLDPICGRGMITCVRYFAESYPPDRIKSVDGITPEVFKAIAKRMMVYGYVEKDNKWQKLSAEEMQDWVAELRFEALVHRDRAMMMAKMKKEMDEAKKNEEVK